jgi:hypothetical protein
MLISFNYPQPREFVYFLQEISRKPLTFREGINAGYLKNNP